jgi:hypothetical protein
MEPDYNEYFSVCPALFSFFCVQGTTAIDTIYYLPIIFNVQARLPELYIICLMSSPSFTTGRLDGGIWKNWTGLLSKAGQAFVSLYIVVF